MSATGKIFEVQHFVLYDGPGIRTVLYLKGCPLKCLWCHNPEGQEAGPELFFYPEKCTSCGACAAVCKQGAHAVSPDGHTLDRTRCVGCGGCVEHCLQSALVYAGDDVTVEDAMREILCDRAFFRTEGGVTLSGGEPLMQIDFTCELLAAAKEAGIRTCMETCGFASRQAVERAAAVTDLFLYDVKELDSERHRQMTGVGNGPILENLRLLNRLGKRVILRCPIIPTQNLNRAHFEEVAALAESLACVEAVELEPYHPLGLSKYAGLGRTAPLTLSEFLPPESLHEHAAAMRAVTGKPVRLSTGMDV